VCGEPTFYFDWTIAELNSMVDSDIFTSLASMAMSNLNGRLTDAKVGIILKPESFKQAGPILETKFIFSPQATRIARYQLFFVVWHVCGTGCTVKLDEIKSSVKEITPATHVPRYLLLGQSSPNQDSSTAHAKLRSGLNIWTGGQCDTVLAFVDAPGSAESVLGNELLVEMKQTYTLMSNGQPVANGTYTRPAWTFGVTAGGNSFQKGIG
jgi:hypothetical protein